MWCDFAGTLKCLEDDYGAIELLNWSKSNGKVDIFIVHPISQPDIILEVEPSHEQNAPTHPQSEAQTRQNEINEPCDQNHTNEPTHLIGPNELIDLIRLTEPTIPTDLIGPNKQLIQLDQMNLLTKITK